MGSCRVLPYWVVLNSAFGPPCQEVTAAAVWCRDQLGYEMGYAVTVLMVGAAGFEAAPLLPKYLRPIRIQRNGWAIFVRFLSLL